MKRKTTKIGLASLFSGLLLTSLSFTKGFRADSITETLSEEITAMKVAVILGLVLIVFAAGCFLVAASTEK